MIGVDPNQVFEAKVASATGVNIWLVGYTHNGVTFLTNAVDKSLTVTSTWTDIDISADTGGDTAIGVIVEHIYSGSNPFYGLRKKGSTDNRVMRQLAHHWAIIGVDPNEVFQGHVTDLPADFFVVGYVTSGAVFKTNADDISLGSTGAYTDIDISTETGTNTATGAFIEVYHSPAVGYNYALRKKGNSEDIYKTAQEHPWAVVPVDGTETLQGKIQSTNLDFFLVGYSTNSPPAPSTAISSAANQAFNVGDPATGISTITVNINYRISRRSNFIINYKNTTSKGFHAC